jgi:membrane associated rhomboid family serine protease
LGKAQVSEVIVTFFGIPLIILIALYLVACSIAPIAQLNNQTFRVIFTLAGGVPTLFFYSKDQIKRTTTTQKA